VRAVEFVDVTASARLGLDPAAEPSASSGPTGPRYVERDLLDPTPARLQPLDLSCGAGFLSSPDPMDHQPWDRPLFRRVVVRPLERVASRFALASPRPLLIGLIAILAKEIATRQIELDLLNTPDDAVWKPGATGVLRQAQANLDRRIRTIVSRGYVALLDDEIRLVREDPFGAFFLYNNLLSKASAIFSAQVSNVTMELASSFEDQVIESLEIITALSEVDSADAPAANADGVTAELAVALGAVAATGGEPKALVATKAAIARPRGWRPRLSLRGATQPRLVPTSRADDGAAVDALDAELEELAMATDADGVAIALRAVRVGTDSAAQGRRRAGAGGASGAHASERAPRAADADAVVGGGGASWAGGVAPRETLTPPPTGRQRVRQFVGRVWSNAATGVVNSKSDARAALASVVAAVRALPPSVKASAPQPPALLFSQREAVRSRLRKLLGKVDALVRLVDRDGNEELSLDEVLALVYDDQDAPPTPGGARAGEDALRAGELAPGISPAAVAWAEGLHPLVLSRIRATVLIKSTARARNAWDRLQAILLAPVVIGLNSTGVAARATVRRFRDYVADTDLNGDGDLTADEVRAARRGAGDARARALLARRAQAACLRARARGVLCAPCVPRRADLLRAAPLRPSPRAPLAGSAPHPRRVGPRARRPAHPSREPRRQVLQALLGDDLPVCEPLRTQLARCVVFKARSGRDRWWESVPDALAVQALVDLNSTGVVRATALGFDRLGRALGLPTPERHDGALRALQMRNATAKERAERLLVPQRRPPLEFSAWPARAPASHADARLAGRSHEAGDDDDAGGRARAHERLVRPDASEPAAASAPRRSQPWWRWFTRLWGAGRAEPDDESARAPPDDQP
jgi:hypothetical protein